MLGHNEFLEGLFSLSPSLHPISLLACFLSLLLPPVFLHPAHIPPAHFLHYFSKGTVPLAVDEFSSSLAPPDIPLRIDSWCRVLVEYSTVMREAVDNNTLFPLDVESHGSVKDKLGQQNTDTW